MKRLSRRQLLATAGTALAGATAGCSTSIFGGAGSEGPGSADPGGADPVEGTLADPTESPVPTPAEGGTAVTEVYRETVGSVVLIRASTPQGRGQGSGFVFRSRNYLLTNQHVVEGATELEVRYSRGDWRTGEIVGTDYYSDLAVVEVGDPPEYATPLPLVETEPPIGTRIVAIGNPFGLEKTVSEGVISGTNRSMDVNYQRPGGFSIPDAVQTDAALNPGNSGGPLLTLGGKVVGVVRAGRGDNIGFGISAALTRRVASELIATGEFEHTFVGVTLEPVTPAVAEANGIGVPRGIIVVDTFEDSPASGVLHPSDESTSTSSSTEGDGAASIPVGGDVLLAIDGVELTTTEDLGSYLALETGPGQTVEFRVLRDGSELTVPLELGERPPVDL